MYNLEELLAGGDLRSIGKSKQLLTKLSAQEQFDALFAYLAHSDRLLAMRAADVLEKVTRSNTVYLKPHKKDLITLAKAAVNAEIIWHLAPLISRVTWEEKELREVVHILTDWSLDKGASKIARVNALQALFDLQQSARSTKGVFERVSKSVFKENIPSINARIRKLRRTL